MLEELGDRLLHVHSQVAYLDVWVLGGTGSKSTERQIFVKKLFDHGNMLQEHCSSTLRNNQMRGLRLFVRPIEPSDEQTVRTFLEGNERSAATPAWGLLGKLLGDVVAVVSLDMTGDALRVADIVVQRDLRKKWIGRAMMREVEQLAVKMDRNRVVVDDARDAQEFFRRVGFQTEGERWVRVVP